MRTWNIHRIRTARNRALPSGRPIIMYAIPELYGTLDHLKETHQRVLELCEEECKTKDGIPCDRLVYELCLIIMEEMHWPLPTDPYDMCDLYISLRAEIKNQLI